MSTQLKYSPIDLLPPATCLLLFILRSIEMARRRSGVEGTVTAPYTLAGLVGSGTIVVACAVWEYFREQRTFVAGLYAAGLIVSILSFILRARAAKALGPFWSMQIELRSSQPLVTDGPYGWVRHPIYAAAILEMIAALLLCQAVWALIPALLLFAPLLVLRIRLEERAMLRHFGERYSAYMLNVPAIVGFHRLRRPQLQR